MLEIQPFVHLNENQLPEFARIDDFLDLAEILGKAQNKAQLDNLIGMRGMHTRNFFEVGLTRGGGFFEHDMPSGFQRQAKEFRVGVVRSDNDNRVGNFSWKTHQRFLQRRDQHGFRRLVFGVEPLPQFRVDGYARFDQRDDLA
ncbi:hypothetical protein SDC9_212368 [bioreactor metagenome]|uniref:Uncharacterized protein n=1 Tax=bioreactor metagenome TaxID=1076179 RepID=A0A645JMS3_9ZZZZ